MPKKRQKLADKTRKKAIIEMANWLGEPPVERTLYAQKEKLGCGQRADWRKPGATK
jgi:hypothetical protein